MTAATVTVIATGTVDTIDDIVTDGTIIVETITGAMIVVMIVVITTMGTVIATDLISAVFLWIRDCFFLSDGTIGGKPFSYRE